MSAVRTAPATRFQGDEGVAVTETLAVEQPLEIRLVGRRRGDAFRETVAVTMRTPGNDGDLAAGFLFTEGIIPGLWAIAHVEQVDDNRVDVELETDAEVDLAPLDRHSFVTSSCGVCGKKSIAAVHVRQRFVIAPRLPPVAPKVVRALPETLRRAQPAFDLTGGLHAAALFDEGGRLLAVREDVGRHNALDKLVGARLLAGALPSAEALLLVSGRASFELVQKAAVAGIPVLASVGAPSSLAVELARDRGMTLLGFVRDGRFNVYSDAGRVRAPSGDHPLD